MNHDDSLDDDGPAFEAGDPIWRVLEDGSEKPDRIDLCSTDPNTERHFYKMASDGHWVPESSLHLRMVIAGMETKIDGA